MNIKEWELKQEISVMLDDFDDDVHAFITHGTPSNFLFDFICGSLIHKLNIISNKKYTLKVDITNNLKHKLIC